MRFGDELANVLSELGAERQRVDAIRLEGNKLQSTADAVQQVIDPASGALKNALTWVQLFDQTLTVDGTFTFSGIRSGYRHLRLVGSLRSDYAPDDNDATFLQFNGDTGNNYYSLKADLFHANTVNTVELLAGDHIVASVITATGGQANDYSPVDINLPDYSSATHYKNICAYGFAFGSTPTTNMRLEMDGGCWFSVAPITAIKAYPGLGTSFVAGSRLTLYGLG